MIAYNYYTWHTDSSESVLSVTMTEPANKMVGYWQTSIRRVWLEEDPQMHNTAAGAHQLVPLPHL